MSTSPFTMRIDENLKQQAFGVFEQYGITPIQAVKMFFTQVAKTHKIPLSLEYQSNEPNEETKRAIKEAEEDFAAGRLTGYTNLQAMVKDILEWVE